MTSIPFTPDEYFTVLNNKQGSSSKAFEMTYAVFIEDVPSQNLMEFTEELAARHLPALAENYRAELAAFPTFDPKGRINIAVIFNLGGATPVPSFLRFARDHQGAGLLLGDLLKSLHKQLPQVVVLQGSYEDESSDAFCAALYLRDLSSLLTTLLIVCPDATNIIKKANSFDVFLPSWFESLASALRRFSSDSFEAKGSVEQTVKTLFLLSLALTQKSTGGLSSEMGPESGNAQNMVVTRAGCELAMGGECKKGASEDQLMNCGRCKAVRYCSKEHKVAHWKIHKQLCFEPTW